MAKGGLRESATTSRDHVGWGFWLISFAVLFGPGYYAAYHSVYESERGRFVPWVIAFTLAAVGAGILSATVNYVLRTRAASAKKQARQQKKK